MRFLVSILFFVAIFLSRASAQTADSAKYINLPPGDFRFKLQNDNEAMLIDVREQFEYRKSRIKGAVNIPSSGNLDFASDTIDKTRNLYLYCTSGFRSKRVCAKFAEKGFAEVNNLDGGIKRWKEEGNPVERKKIRR